MSLKSTDYLSRVLKWDEKNIEKLSDRFFETANIMTPENQIPGKVREILSEIIMEFDRSSIFSCQGDAYRFGKYFMAMLHKSISLYVLLQGEDENWEDPVNTLKMIVDKSERKFLTDLFPDIGTEENYNRNKSDFISWLIDLSVNLAAKYGNEILPLPVDVMKKYLKAVYKRDYLMNFRDVSALKHVYRSAMPSLFTTSPEILLEFLAQNDIKLIIDLRGDKEKNKNNNTREFEEIKNKLGIREIVVDFNEGPGEEESYLRKVIQLKNVILTVFTEALETTSRGQSILFHCHSGKDRTGVIAALLQKMAGVSDENVIADYSASGQDSHPTKIVKILEYINSVGGIEKYLDSCGFDNISQKQLYELITE